MNFISRTLVVFAVGSCMSASVLLAEPKEGNHALNPERSSPVVAEVNNVKISRARLDGEIQRQVGAQFLSLKDDDLHQFRSQFLSRMIERELLYQAAEAAKVIPEDTEVKRLIENLKLQFASPEAFEAMLQSRGLDEQQFFAGLRQDLAIRSFVQNSIFAGLSVSEQEAEAAYRSNPERFTIPTEIHARHIFFPLPASADAKTINQLRARAAEVLELAKKQDADFSELAKAHSAGTQKVKGGDLGYFTSNQFEPAFSNAAFALEPGGISEIVQTQHGLHIIKVEDKRGGNIPPFLEAKDSIRASLLRDKQSKAYEKYLEALRTRAKLIVYIN